MYQASKSERANPRQPSRYPSSSTYLPAKLPNRLHGEVLGFGPLARPREALCLETSIEALLREKLVHAIIVIVDQPLPEVSSRSIESDELVDVTPFIVANPTGFQQTKLVVRRPASMTDPTTPDIVPTRNPVPHRRLRIDNIGKVPDFAREGWARPFVDIHEKDPRVGVIDRYSIENRISFDRKRGEAPLNHGSAARGRNRAHPVVVRSSSITTVASVQVGSEDMVPGELLRRARSPLPRPAPVASLNHV